MTSSFTAEALSEDPAPRRSHAERSAATRSLLLDATIECLADLGYAHTSTTEIVRRAGLSRGAQVHHFPTKAQLVVAALHHLVQRQEQAFDERFEALPPARRTPAAALDVLWSLFDGPLYRALVQFSMAALTDDQLKPDMGAVLDRLEHTVVARFHELFPAFAGEAIDHSVRLSVRAMQSAALYRQFGLTRSADEVMEELHRVLVTAGPRPAR